MSNQGPLIFLDNDIRCHFTDAHSSFFFDSLIDFLETSDEAVGIQ